MSRAREIAERMFPPQIFRANSDGPFEVDINNTSRRIAEQAIQTFAREVVAEIRKCAKFSVLHPTWTARLIEQMAGLEDKDGK